MQTTPPKAATPKPRKSRAKANTKNHRAKTPANPKGAGRPTRYMPAYCQKLIDSLARGQTLAGFAGEIGVNKDTLGLWVKAQPEFARAKAIGECKREAFLVDLGLKIATGYYEKSNATSWIFMMKNMCGWRDKKDVNVGGQPDGTPIITMTRAEKQAEIDRLQAARRAADGET